MKNNIVYIVFEYAEPTNKIIGIYKNKKYAKKAHMESPSWRYIEEHIVHLNFKLIIKKGVRYEK